MIQAVATEQRTVLEVGCGPSKRLCHWSFEGWKHIRVDCNPDCEPDILASMLDMPMINSASMDAVFSSHSMEHLHSHEVPVALHEFLRVLKPGGAFLMHCPDFQQACQAVAEGRGEQYLYQAPCGPICAMDMIFGWHKTITCHDSMNHRWGFTKPSLFKTLTQAGFEGVETWVEQFDLWGVGYKQ